MVDCPLELDATGRWRCPQCGRLLPLRPSPRPPRRNCPQAPDRATLVAVELLVAVVNGRLGVPLVEVERRLAVCRGCPSFCGSGCREIRCGEVDWFASLIHDRRRPSRLRLCRPWS